MAKERRQKTCSGAELPVPVLGKGLARAALVGTTCDVGLARG